MGRTPLDVATAPEVKQVLAAAKPTRAPASAGTSFAAEFEEAEESAALPEQKAATVVSMASHDAEAAADGGATVASGKRQADEAPEAAAQPPSKAPKSSEDEA